mgnify:CR=1 FL=1
MNIVMAMNMGADDFISKPFDQSVLIAKIQALLRRAYDFGETLPILEHHGAMLNTGDNTLVYQDQVISLTKNEYRILFTLMKNKGKVVSREKLMEQLWETDSFVDDKHLNSKYNEASEKLESAGLTQFVTTKFGIGYLISYETGKDFYAFFLLFIFKQRRAGTGVFILFSIIFICVFALYHLPVEAVLYPAGICATLGAGYLLFDFQRPFGSTKSFRSFKR